MKEEEEDKEYEELKNLLYTGQLSQYGKRKIIKIIETQKAEIENLKWKNNIYVKSIKSHKAEIEKLEKQSKNLDKEAQAYFEESIGDDGLKNRTIAQLQAEIKKKDKAMDLMAEQLTSPINDKKWVIEYYTKLTEEEK